jgi:hypothetical protein
MNRKISLLATALAVLALSGCASQIPAGVEHANDTPGFWWGLWHGFVFPWAWIGSLFDPKIAVYAVPNTGGWYDFGFFLGVTVLGGGAGFGARHKKG